jgi:zinc transport system permease protein
MAVVVSMLSGRGYAMDTLLGVLAHASLAFGLVAVSLLQGVRIDMMAYLFGDILAVGKLDLGLIWAGTLVVLALLWWRWSALLTATLNTDLAYASGIDPKREQLFLTIALALVVAVAIKVVGVLLIAAMLIIPAAAARVFARTPEAMAVIAIGIGSVSTLIGIQASLMWDTPTGPTIVCVAASLFALSNGLRLVSR